MLSWLHYSVPVCRSSPSAPAAAYPAGPRAVITERIHITDQGKHLPGQGSILRFFLRSQIIPQIRIAYIHQSPANTRVSSVA